MIPRRTFESLEAPGPRRLAIGKGEPPDSLGLIMPIAPVFGGRVLR